MNMLNRMGAVALAMAACPAMADSGVFYTDFSTADARVSGAGELRDVEGFAGLGVNDMLFDGLMLVNDSVQSERTTVTLTGLGEHSAIRVEFLLALIDSWDGLEEENWGPDSFNIAIDGVTMFSEVFSNRGGDAGRGTYEGPAVNMLAAPSSLGFHPWHLDSAIAFAGDGALEFAHTGSTLTIEFWASGPAWQGGDDESFGIDNLSVTLVPGPGAAGVLLIATGFATRRRR